MSYLTLTMALASTPFIGSYGHAPRRKLSHTPTESKQAKKAKAARKQAKASKRRNRR